MIFLSLFPEQHDFKNYFHNIYIELGIINLEIVYKVSERWDVSYIVIP